MGSGIISNLFGQSLCGLIQNIGNRTRIKRFQDRSTYLKIIIRGELLRLAQPLVLLHLMVPHLFDVAKFTFVNLSAKERERRGRIDINIQLTS